METLQEVLESEDLRAEARREFEILEAISLVVEKANQPELCSIRALVFFPGFNAIVMEELQLRMLKEFYPKLSIVTGNPKRWQTFETLLGLAGRWLRIFHEAFGSERMESLAQLDVWKQVETELGRLEAVLDRSLVDLRAKFLATYKEMENVKMPVAALHKDYHLGNIFVTTDGKVGVLDPNWQERGSIYEDLARIMLDSSTRKAQVLSRGLYFHPRLVQRYEEALLNGYQDSRNFDRRLLYFYCALATLTKWRMNEEKLRNTHLRRVFPGMSVLRHMIRGYFLNLVESYLKRTLRQAVYRGYQVE